MKIKNFKKLIVGTAILGCASLYAFTDGLEFNDLSDPAQRDEVIDTQFEAGEIIRAAEINAKFNALKERIVSL